MSAMVVLVLDNVDLLDEVLMAWWDAGAPGVTILESSGAARYLARSGPRDDLPIFPSLSSLFAHSERHHRTLFTILPDVVPVKRIFDATERVLGPLESHNSGIIFALPVLDARGHQRTERAE
jgi:hypothetical protein